MPTSLSCLTSWPALSLYRHGSTTFRFETRKKIGIAEGWIDAFIFRISSIVKARMKFHFHVA
jgi:hypothetical protein